MEASLAWLRPYFAVAAQPRHRGESMHEERTFLVRMKLVPMANELDMASARPMYLSSTMTYDV